VPASCARVSLTFGRGWVSLKTLSFRHLKSTHDYTNRTRLLWHNHHTSCSTPLCWLVNSAYCRPLHLLSCLPWQPLKNTASCNDPVMAHCISGGTYLLGVWTFHTVGTLAGWELTTLLSHILRPLLLDVDGGLRLTKSTASLTSACCLWTASPCLHSKSLRDTSMYGCISVNYINNRTFLATIATWI
jgi:hypothetical protein